MADETIILGSTDPTPATDTAGRYMPLLHVQQRLAVVNYRWNPLTLAYEVETVTAGGTGSDVNVTNPTLAVTSSQLPGALGGSGGLKVEVIASTGGGLTDTQLRASPVPVADGGGSLTVDGTVAVSGSVAVTGPLTDTQLRATAVPVSGTVTATGPLTDTQLRATAVPVSGPLTDTQLRASAVPVSVSGSVAVTGTFWQATQPVSGPLTDTQLRATAVPVSVPGSVAVTGAFFQATQPVSATALPLPTGASTEATLALIKAKTDNLDVALSTRTKPADTQAVSAIALPLPTGASTEATLALVKAKTDNITKADTDHTLVTALPTYGGKTITYVPVAQSAAGTTLLAAADATKKNKIVGCVLTMSAGGTLKFIDSSGDLTGAMDIATQGGMVWTAGVFPYCETGAINRSLSLVTTTGAAKGVVAILVE